MPTTPYSVYEIQLQNQTRGGFAGTLGVAASGGKFIICVAGSPDKETLYDADSQASLANPVTPTRGKIRFATAATVLSVDIYGFTPDGCFIVRKGVKPGGENEIFYNPHEPNQTAVVPFHYSDYTIASEQDTGLDFPAGALVLPTVALRVTAADATETMDWGLLASESGGDADGFLVAVSVGSTGTVPGLLVGTDTLGALLKEDTNGSSVLVPKPHPIATATSIVLNFSTGSDTAAGFGYFPYINLVN